MDIQIQVEGITPLLVNKFTDAAAQIVCLGSHNSYLAADRGTPLEIAVKFIS
jgi:hypothetical protein